MHVAVDALAHTSLTLVTCHLLPSGSLARSLPLSLSLSLSFLVSSPFACFFFLGCTTVTFCSQKRRCVSRDTMGEHGCTMLAGLSFPFIPVCELGSGCRPVCGMTSAHVNKSQWNAVTHMRYFGDTIAGHVYKQPMKTPVDDNSIAVLPSPLCCTCFFFSCVRARAWISINGKSAPIYHTRPMEASHNG